MAERSDRCRALVVSAAPDARQQIAERIALEGYHPTLLAQVEDGADEIRAGVFLIAAIAAEQSERTAQRVRELDPTLALIAVGDPELSGGRSVPLDPPESFWRALRSADERTRRARRVLGAAGSLLDALPDAVWAIDADHCYVFVSSTAEDLLDSSAHDLLGRSILDHKPSGDSSWSAGAFEVVLAEGCPFARFEREIETPEGRRRTLETSATPRFDESGELAGYIGIDRDITDRLAAERERVRREVRRREEQLQGQLAHLSGELAHDLNNVLTAILGYAEMSRAESQAGTTRAAVDRIEAVAARAVELGRSLAMISGAGTDPMELVDLKRIVRDCVASLEGVSVEVIGAEDEAIWVHGVASRLLRALSEVIANACEASPADRPVRVIVEPVELGRRTGGRITVEDEGRGIPASVAGDAFAPFTTSKPRGVGTGLGLTVARSLIGQHRGTLSLEGREGGGTRCILELPGARGAGGERRRDEAPVVLVAEDHAQVRQLVTEALSAAGFPCLAAADGDEALRLIEVHMERIRFAIVDLDLPGRSGLSLLQACRRRKPGLPALIMTGRTEPFAAGEAPSDVAILRKPFVLTELLDSVRRAWEASERVAAEAEA